MKKNNYPQGNLTDAEFQQLLNKTSRAAERHAFFVHKCYEECLARYEDRYNY